MSDHTPGTGDVRAAYARAMRQAFIASTGEHLEEFDRWLDEHDRQVAARTLRGEATFIRGTTNFIVPQGDEESLAQYFEDVADGIEKGLLDVY